MLFITVEHVEGNAVAPEGVLPVYIAPGERVLRSGCCVGFIEATFGMVWDPGRFRGIAPRRGREEVGEPCGRTRPNPHALAMPGATQLAIVGLWKSPVRTPCTCVCTFGGVFKRELDFRR